MLNKANKKNEDSFLNEIKCSSVSTGYTSGKGPEDVNSAVSSDRPKVSVALDWENILRSYRESYNSWFGWNEMRKLDAHIHEHYDVLNKKAYVDSSTNNGSKKILDYFGYTVVNVPSRIKESEESREILIKNAVDVELAFDVYDEVIECKGLSAVILLSGDEHFLPVIKRIKRRGVDVFVFACRGHLSRLLANFASRVFYLGNPIPEPQKSTKMVVELFVQEEINLQLLEAIHAGDDNSILISNALNRIHKRLDSKTLNDLGVKKVRDLVKEYPAMFQGLRIDKDRFCGFDVRSFSPLTSGGEALC